MTSAVALAAGETADISGRGHCAPGALETNEYEVTPGQCDHMTVTRYY